MNFNNQKYSTSGLPEGAQVLVLSTDAKIFEENSEVRQRLTSYGSKLAVLHIVVYTRKNSGYASAQIAPNVFIHPTNSSKLFYFWNSYGIAERLLKSGGAWLITCQDPFETGWLGWLLTWQFREAILQIQIHTDFLSPYFRRESFKNKLRALCARFILKRANSIRVVSLRIYRSLTTYSLLHPGQEILLAPILVEPQKFKTSNAELKGRYNNYDRIILMVGRFTKEKNIILAIQAMAEVVKKHPKTLLLLVGAGPEEQNIEAQIASLKLNENIIIEPWAEDVNSYYALADIYLLASNYEGYSRTVVEAMAARLPVIMTDVGIAGEVLIDGHNGLIIPVNDVQSLNMGLSRLLEDKKYCQALGTAAKNSVDKVIRTTQQDFQPQILPVILKKKLCYVVPNYQRHDATHFNYLSGFIKSISNDFDIALVIEKGVEPSDNFGCRRVLVPWPGLEFMRGIELFLKFLYLRILGYRDFYIHYSFLSAFCAKFADGRVFYWNCGEPWKYQRSAAREFFERLVYKKIDYLVTGTEGLGKQYAEHYNLHSDQVKIMPNWIDLEKFKNQISKIKINKLKESLNIKLNQKVILFVHRLSRRKGAHYLPEILKRLSNRSNLILLVIGAGPEKSNLKLGNQGRFLGSIPNDELPNYYTLADVFIMPSDEEGFPHVLLETMAAGVPYVASDVGGVKEITPKVMYNYLINAGDINAFSAAIEKLLAIPDKNYQELKVTLQNLVKSYDIAAVAEQFKALLQ